MENEESKKDNLISHPVVKAGAIINLEVSELFLRRCQKLLFALAGHMGEEKFVKALEDLKEDKPIETIEDGILDVILPLVDGLEKAAEKQGLIENKQFSAEELRKSFESL